ncbi:MAG: hypothetical protein ACN4GR_04135 [Arenicellales bacterium]
MVEAKANIDVDLPDSLQKKLAAATCYEIPELKIPSISLPTGGVIKAVGEFTDRVPSECALNMNLLVQLGPILANLHCIIKIMGVIEPLHGVADAMKSADVLKIAEAAPALVEALGTLINDCVLKLTVPPLGIACFLASILKLIVKILSCMVDMLASMVSLITDLSSHLIIANKEGNTALAATLECSLKNAQTSTNNSMAGLDPITAVLEMMTPLLAMAGQDPIQMPSLDQLESVEQLENAMETLEEVVSAIELVADTLASMCES